MSTSHPTPGCLGGDEAAELEAVQACGGSKPCPVPTRWWAPFQHGYFLASAAKTHQLVMAKCFRRISSGNLLTSSTVSQSMNAGKKEKFLCVSGVPCLLPPPKAPFTDLVTFFRHHLFDHIVWLLGHLLSERTGKAVGWGLNGYTHPFVWGRTSLPFNPVV